MTTAFEEMISGLPTKLLSTAIIDDNKIFLEANIDKHVLYDRCSDQINTDGVTGVSPPTITTEKAIYAFLLTR